MKLSMTDLASQKFQRNPFPTYAKMRAEGPLIRGKVAHIGEVWLTTTYEATTTVLRDKAAFVTEPKNAGRKSMAGLQWWMPSSLRAMTNNMLGKDEPDHRRLRQLVESAFMRQSIEDMRLQIARFADRQLDNLEQQAQRNGGRVDLIEHFARPFPLTVIGELLGLPDEDRQQFARWASSFTSLNSTLGIFKLIRALGKMNRYFKQQFEVCRRQPRPGMISAMVKAEQEGGRLNPEELLASSFLLLIAGHETTVHLITLGVLTLHQHPDQKQALMTDWSKAHAAVEEILRYATPVQMTKPRYASRDVNLYGRQMKQGEVILPLLGAANCDPDQFPEPETFDINRSQGGHVALERECTFVSD